MIFKKKLLVAVIGTLVMALASASCSFVTDPDPTPAPAPPSDDHGDARVSATGILPGVAINGEIEALGDVDFFAFLAEPGKEYSIETQLISHDDTVIRLHDSAEFIDSDDNGGEGAGSKLVWTGQAAGYYYIEVSGTGRAPGVGTYRLSLLARDAEPTPAPTVEQPTPIPALTIEQPAPTPAPALALADTPTPIPAPMPAPADTPAPAPEQAAAPEARLSSISFDNSVELGESFELNAGLINYGDPGDAGGISISFPTLTDRGKRADGFSSPQADIQVVSAPGSVSFYETGDSVFERSSGAAATARHLLVEYHSGAWARDSENRLALRITPKRSGQLPFLIRGWICADGYASCSRDPSSGFEDQQGLSARNMWVDVVAPPPTNTPTHTPTHTPTPEPPTPTPTPLSPTPTPTPPTVTFMPGGAVHSHEYPGFCPSYVEHSHGPVTHTPPPYGTCTPTPTPSVSVTPTHTPTITVTSTVTPTPTITPTITVTPTVTPTPTITPTGTVSVTPTHTPTNTPTPTPTNTPTPTPTFTPTPTPTPTNTPALLHRFTGELGDMFQFLSDPAPASGGQAADAVRRALGNEWRVADWNDIRNAWNIDRNQLSRAFQGRYYHVTRNGDWQWGSTGRIFFVTDHDGDKPRNFLSHAQLGGDEINLGSFSGTDSWTILAFRPQPTPTPEPRSGRIAFNSNVGNQSEIYTINADGSGLTRLTNNSADDWDPVLTRDGRRVAFTSTRDGNHEIYAMNADGSGVTRLTNNSAKDWYLSWSPDGRRIAFTSDRNGNLEIYAMNADGSGVTRLTNNSARDYDPSWSPDGRRIAFVSDRDGNREIYAMNADGSGATRLTNSSGEDKRASWSPDSRRITFTSYRDGNGEIYAMNADGSGVTRLTNNSAHDAHSAWSPDGRYIVFDSDKDNPRGIYVMNADGSGVGRLANISGWRPHWGP